MSSSSKMASARMGHPSSPANGKLMPISAFRQKENERKAAAALERQHKQGNVVKRARQACTTCQHLKMRCVGPSSGEGKCDRCSRLGRECLVQERKPHKPWTKRKDLQIQQLTNRLEQMEDLLLKATPQPLEKGKETASSEDLANGVDLSVDSLLRQAPSANEMDVQQDPIPEHHLETYPAQEVTAGAISGVEPTTFENDVEILRQHAQRLPFLASGKISPEEACDLFHTCMRSCTMHTVILNPQWHTVKRCIESSHFLFAVVIYIASIFYRPRKTLRKELEDEMDLLIGRTITSGKKSVEVVQAFLLLYQWNLPSSDPSEDRAWVLAGVAIRIAIELKLHRPQRRPTASSNEAYGTSDSREKGFIPTETDEERANRERCWLMTFCVDRSLSMAVGRPWTISENAKLVRDAAIWSNNAYCRSWDLGISALCDLLKLASRQSDILKIAFTKWSAPMSADDDDNCETMMRVMNEELEHWRRQWYVRGFFTSPVERKDSSLSALAFGATMHQDYGGATALTDLSPSNSHSASNNVNTDLLDMDTRTLHYITKQASLRYNFAVLVTNSYGLQYCSKRSGMSRTRSACKVRAIHAAHGILKAARDGIGATMTYSPQTQYTILGFALITMIKLSLLDEAEDDGGVRDRLIASVENGIMFLESVAISSEHTAARLASLVRAFLRRTAERQGKTDAGNVEGLTVDGQAGSEQERSHRSRRVHISDEVQSRRVTDDEDEAENDTGAFAPGLDPYNLPQRSSRAVTPDGGVALIHQHQHEKFGPAALSDGRSMSISGMCDDTPIPVPLMLPNGHPSHESRSRFPAPSEATSNATHSDQQQPWPSTGGNDVESLMQSLGFFGSVDASGWSQMTVDEILDNTFWLQLDERNDAF